jgi:hypothetical protein
VSDADGELDLPPGQIDIRVMSLGLCELAHSVGKGERFPKVIERKDFFQMVLVDGPPGVPEPPLKVR